MSTKLVDSLTPSDKSRAAVAEPQGKGMDKGKDATLRTCIRVPEKRLKAALWRCDGVDYKGSHFPMCAFTNNVGRRPPEKLKERAERAWNNWNSRSGAEPPWPQGSPSPWCDHRSRGSAEMPASAWGI